MIVLEGETRDGRLDPDGRRSLVSTPEARLVRESSIFILE